MKAVLFVSEAGVALLDEKLNPIKAVKFKEKANEKYSSILSGKPVGELKELLSGFKGELLNPYAELSELLQQIYRSVRTDSDMLADVEGKKLELMVRTGLVKSEEEALEAIRDYSLYYSTIAVKQQVSRLDQHAIQLINAIDEVDKGFNLFYMRLREWYGLHFPELYSMLSDPEQYISFVLAFPNRAQISEDALEKFGIPKKKAEAIAASAEASKGAEFNEEMYGLIKRFAELSQGLVKLRKDMVKGLENIMKNIAPNVTSLVGATVGARLLAKAGGLEKLAKMPASTIQVLGAEKALFRALRKHAKPPKHGIIFQNKYVHDAPKKIRGKVARALATKLAIAARIDFYTGRSDENILKSFLEKVEEIRKEYESSIRAQQRSDKGLDKRKGK